MISTVFLVMTDTRLTESSRWRFWKRGFVEQAALFGMVYNSESFDQVFDSRTSEYRNRCFSLGPKAFENVEAVIQSKGALGNDEIWPRRTTLNALSHRMVNFEI